MCKSLKDYSEYTERVRKYAREVPIEEAVERAIRECVEEEEATIAKLVQNMKLL